MQTYLFLWKRLNQNNWYFKHGNNPYVQLTLVSTQINGKRDQIVTLRVLKRTSKCILLHPMLRSPQTLTTDTEEMKDRHTDTDFKCSLWREWIPLCVTDISYFNTAMESVVKGSHLLLYTPFIHWSTSLFPWQPLLYPETLALPFPALHFSSFRSVFFPHMTTAYSV